MAQVWWEELQREKGQKAEREFVVAAFIITLALFPIIWNLTGGGFMAKRVIGVVDMYGVQYYYDQQQANEEVKKDLFQRALKAGDRKACYFEAEVSEKDDEEIRGMLERNDYVGAAHKLGSSVERLWLPTGQEWQEQWEAVTKE